MNATKYSPVPVTCYTGAPVCVVQPATPNVCTPLPPCAAEPVPVNSDVMLALCVLAVVLIAAMAMRRTP